MHHIDSLVSSERMPLEESEESALERACRTVNEDLDILVEKMVAHVCAELPNYRTLVSTQGHSRAVRDTASALLRALGTAHPLSSEDARMIRYTAMTRENEGVPVYDVMAAFHVVGRDVWQALRSSLETDADTLVQLLDPFWAWIQETSAHVAEAYASGSGGIHGRQVVLRQRMLESIRNGDATDPECAELARRLDFVPGGMFRALCTEASPWLEGGLDVLHKALSRLRGVCQSGVHGTLMIVLTQGADAREVAKEICRHLDSRAAVGIGLERAGLAGAETSIGDAERSLRVAWPGAVSSFENAWLHASLVDSRTRLTPLYGSAKAIAFEHPSLAEAVRAFATQGFSLASAAATLRVHPNTVAYRLDRWQELSGLDPRHFDGLARSMLSIGPAR